MKHKGTRIIETGRLILRPFCLADIPYVYQNWASDAAVTKYLRWPPHRDISVTETVLRDWIASYQKPDFYQWAIVAKSSMEPIGSISAVDQTALREQLDIIHIGYCIGRSWWHQGITSEAFAAVIPFFFYEVGARRIETQHDPNNPHSGGVMKKCGLTYEGTLRRADISNQGIVDACMYSILKEEYTGS